MVSEVVIMTAIITVEGSRVGFHAENATTVEEIGIDVLALLGGVWGKKLGDEATYNLHIMCKHGSQTAFVGRVEDLYALAVDLNKVVEDGMTFTTFCLRLEEKMEAETKSLRVVRDFPNILEVRN